MIENAVVRLPGREIKTRLHEHGIEPIRTEDQYARSRWRETGYFDGSPQDMKDLFESKLDPVAVHVGDKLDSTLTGVVWCGWEETYPGHAVAHLHWEPKQEFE